MGTNYYAVKRTPTTLSPIHIGKVSYGWLFNFQSHNEPWNDPPVVWNTYKQVYDWLYEHVVEKRDYLILDEYDHQCTFGEFFAMVDQIQDDKKFQRNPDNFKHCKNVDGYRFTDDDFC